jgi:hypothetical protein
MLIPLTVADASFAFPSMLSMEGYSYALDLNQLVRPLVGIVLRFRAYFV